MGPSVSAQAHVSVTFSESLQCLELNLHLNRYDNMDAESELFAFFSNRFRVDCTHVNSVMHMRARGPPDNDGVVMTVTLFCFAPYS